ncbi:hypothetical protein MLD38_007966 [Melastoma candidum]|uniref:Uncharacterized protein n=1 Tax=Melastoma candidum TaxID=119954 RepID=A0ACB9RVW2_9MYRT|nr:hypothetical protein MLD38_007966 [Melastoma candidum]
MATFFRPSPSILTPSDSINPVASRSTWPAHLSLRSSDLLTSPDETGASVNTAAIGRQPVSRTQPAVGCFTEEKAKQMRRKTAEGYSFHDVMYHSAIASRLATDVSCRSLRYE